MREAGVATRVVMKIGSRESIREAVAKGIGLGVVSEAEFIPDPRLRALPVSDAEIHTRGACGSIWRRGRTPAWCAPSSPC